jgi:hypothetical protein
MKLPMSGRPRPLPLVRRAIAALVVGVWVLGLVGSVFHATSGHEHAYCSQHKTFEEIGNAGALVDGVAASAGSASEAAAAWHATPAASVAQHEACAFADLGVRAPLEEHFRLDLARPTPPPLAPAPPAVHVSIQIPLLANAPKASPPSASV